MENYTEFVKGINTYLISGIFISILFIALIRLLFKNKIDTHYALSGIKWLLIIYSGLALIGYVLMIIFPDPKTHFSLKRATGPYAWAFWTMLTGNMILPFLLLIKKLGNKIYFLLLMTFISIMMNIGYWFERIVITVTSLDRDYITEEFTENTLFWVILLTIFNWIIIGILFLIGGNLYKYFKEKTKAIN